jgi:hypothetical protein
MSSYVICTIGFLERRPMCLGNFNPFGLETNS